MAIRMSRRRAGRTAVAAILLAVIAYFSWQSSQPVIAYVYRRQAERFLEKQNYPRALAAYQQAIRYLPDSIDLNLHAARTARRCGNLDLAREHLRRCRELQSGVSEEQQLEAYLVRAQGGEVDEVSPYLAPYVSHDGPFTTLVLEGLARAYMGKYRAGPAWGCISRWLELEPNNAEARYRRGLWFAQQQNAREASEDFRRALELDPDRTDVRLTYSEILQADKKFTDVAEQYEIVLRRSPGNPDALLGLAQAYIELGRAEEAPALLDAVPADRQDTADYLWVRGLVELQADRPEKAEPLFRRALERAPYHLEACYNLMICLSRLQRTEEAAGVRVRLDQIERDQKRLIQLTTQEFDKQPANADLRCELGEIYLRMGAPERAAHWFYAALKLDPNCRRAHEQLCEYHSGRAGPEAAERAEFHRRHLGPRS